MKRLFVLWLTVASLAPAREVPNDPPVMLPTVEVIASPHVEFFSVTWRTRRILQSSKIKRAWFSRIQPGGPADQAGVKVGDELLRLGGRDVKTMSGADMKASSRQPRSYGTREEIVYRNAKGEVRTVEFIYERIKQQPNPAPGPATPSVTPPADAENPDAASGRSS